MWCVDDIGEERLTQRYEEVMDGPNRQPCEVCGKMVKAEYGFCHICGKVLCGDHDQAHRTSPIPLGELQKQNADPE